MNVCIHCRYAVVEAVEPFKLHPISISCTHKVFQAPSTDVDEHMVAHSHRYHHRRFPRFGRVGGNSRTSKCINHDATPP